jgi:hypothetical protein
MRALVGVVGILIGVVILLRLRGRNLPGLADRAIGAFAGIGVNDRCSISAKNAMPISWKGTSRQYVGRLHRLHNAKRVVRVYDHVDSNVLMLARMYARRLRRYNAIGYGICNTPYQVLGT